MFKINSFAQHAPCVVACRHSEQLGAICAVLCVLFSVFLAGLLPMQQVAAQDSAESESALSPQQLLQWQLGYDMFQMLLEERGLQAVRSYVDAFEAPKETVLVLTGSDSEINATVREKLALFVDAGGAVLILSDGPLTTGLGEIKYTVVECTDRNKLYQGYSDCLLLSADSIDPSLKVRTVVCNRTSFFIPKSNTLNWKPLVSLPRIQITPYAARGKPVISLGRSRLGDQGIALISADASLFTNGMIWHGDNAVLAIEFCKLLSEGDRKRLVFVSGGQLMPSYEQQLSEMLNPPIPEPTLERMLRIANAVAQDVQASNVVNEALSQQPRNVSPRRYFRFMLAVLAGLILLIILWMILRSGTFQTMFVNHRKMKAGYQLRDNAYGANGDYRSAAGYLAREYCYELTGSQQSNDWRQYWEESKAKLRVEGLSAGEIRTLGEVIDIACRGSQSRMSSRDFHQFGLLIKSLRSWNIAKRVSTA